MNVFFFVFFLVFNQFQTIYFKKYNSYLNFMNYRNSQRNWGNSSLDEALNGRSRSSNSSEDRPITSSGKYNMDFIDYNNEFERIYDTGITSTSSAMHHQQNHATVNVPYGMGEQTFVNLMMQDLQNMVEEEEKVGLPEEYLTKIKVMKMGNSNRTCSVCYNCFERGEKIRYLPCKHIFHDDCVLPWLEKNVTCPNCRMNLLDHFQKNLGQDDLMD